MIWYTLITFFYLLAEDHKTDNFLKLNPFHKIPVIDDNGFVLKERYVEEVIKSVRKLQLVIMSRVSTVVLATCHLEKPFFLRLCNNAVLSAELM
jgi:hypothetical protein